MYLRDSFRKVTMTERCSFNSHGFCFLTSCLPAGSLFENEWSLKPEYKRGGNRLELADRLASRILWIGIANLLLCPVILVWQILYAFFSYTEASSSHSHKTVSVLFTALDNHLFCLYIDNQARTWFFGGTMLVPVRSMLPASF